MSESDTKRPAAEVYKRLLGYTRQHWGLGLLAVFGMVIEGAAAGAFTWLMEPMINGTFVAQDAAVMRWVPLAIIALFLVRGVAGFIVDVGMARIGGSVVFQLRSEVLAKYQELPLSSFDREPVAMMVQRLSYTADQVARASADALKIIITDVFTLIALLIVMLYASATLTLTILIVTPVIAGIISVVGKRYRRLNHKVQDATSGLAHSAEQSLHNVEAVKIYAGGAMEVERFVAHAKSSERLNRKIIATQATSSALVQIMAACALGALVWFAGRMAVGSGLDAGKFVSLMTSMMAMLPSLKRLTNVQSQLQRGVAAGDSLFAVLDAESEPAAGTSPVDARQDLVLEGVRFRYADDKPWALDGVDLRIPAGKTTALVGRSGSGKTTLARLLPRFYSPQSGEIRLGALPIESIALAELRRHIAVVSQNVLLFDDTVANNIAYGSLQGASRADIEAAAAAANALEFIRELPQGFDTPIGDRGNRLSGGQRQRLAIARAILKNAPILILDEATSALDSESERLIQDALDRILKDRTAIVIAHRLSTIEHADQVVVMDRGRVQETGNHAELLAAQGAYAHLHKLQFRDE
ncbi:MAG: lipid A export permease/ATP-binding protein MsbA [Ahniella sp.]|nr:lipid A export permease/ATP-binding protein MsbA [Ahniella sp.]